MPLLLTCLFSESFPAAGVLCERNKHWWIYSNSASTQLQNEKLLFNNRYTYTAREQSVFVEHNASMYYRRRMYAPNIGRFEKRDPIGYADSHNLYGYVNALPILLIDQYGLTECEQIIYIGHNNEVPQGTSDNPAGTLSGKCST